MDWGRNFLMDQPDAPHNLLVCLELDDSSLSGFEDIIGIAIGHLALPLPPNLRIKSIKTGKLASSQVDSSDTSPTAFVDHGQVSMRVLH